MTTLTFAAWVEPVAAELRQSRHEVVRAATQYLPEFWGWMSPLQGWTYKDLLAHLATGDWVMHTVLRAVIANEPVEVAKVTNLDWVAEGNARFLAERKERSPEELIAEVEAEGDETQELLSQLSEADEQLTQEGAPMSLSDYLRLFPGHDRAHLAQLRVALDSIML